MALLMVGAAVVSALLLPQLVDAARPASVARNDLLGFLAVAGRGRRRLRRSPDYASRRRSRVRWSRRCSARSTLTPALRERWVDLVALLLGIALHPAAGRLGGARGRASRPCSAA